KRKTKTKTKAKAKRKTKAKAKRKTKTKSKPKAKSKAKPKRKAKAKTKPKAKAKPKAKRKPNAAFMKAMTPDAALAAIVGSKPLPRTEITKRLWDYIKKNNLQDPVNRRNINADDSLKKVFNGKSTVSMFEMTKLVSGHMS
ncbi:MAG TPA: SWIB/MDM2 domain-containing protein, partial [bacterium]|nr:SWIB/MDM2 domain-containing protein [bacterium]